MKDDYVKDRMTWNDEDDRGSEDAVGLLYIHYVRSSILELYLGDKQIRLQYAFTSTLVILLKQTSGMHSVAMVDPDRCIS